MNRALSLWQPWASLVVLGIKKVETRGYYTGVRGKLLIHAAKVTSANMEYVKMAYDEFRPSIRQYLMGTETYLDLPYGAIVGEVELYDCRPTLDANNFRKDHPLYISTEEERYGNYGPNRFAWYLRDPKMFQKPIPYRGMQGFFNVQLPETI